MQACLGLLSSRNKCANFQFQRQACDRHSPKIVDFSSILNMVRTVSMANTFRRLGEDEDHSTIFQEVMQLNGNAQQVVSRIQMPQDMRELGRFVARHDILEACNYVARIEGHLSERFVRWCIAIHFDFDAEYGFYTLKRHRDLDRLFIDTTNGASQAVLPLAFVIENLRIQRTLQN